MTPYARKIGNRPNPHRFRGQAVAGILETIAEIRGRVERLKILEYADADFEAHALAKQVLPRLCDALEEAMRAIASFEMLDLEWGFRYADQAGDAVSHILTGKKPSE